MKHFECFSTDYYLLFIGSYVIIDFMKKIILPLILVTLILAGCSGSVDPNATAKTLGGELVSSVCALKTQTAVTQKNVDDANALAKKYETLVGPKNQKNDWLNFPVEAKALHARAAALKPLVGVKFTPAQKTNLAGQCTFVTNSYTQEFNAIK